MKYTVAFLFNESLDYVALIKKAKPDWQKGRFNGIGGKVEDGETFEEANQREFYEETGLDIPMEEWSKFAKIETVNAEIEFFAAKSKKAFDVRTQPAPPDIREEVRMTHIQSNMFPIMQAETAVENLGWLILMARDHLQDKRPTFAVIMYDTPDTVKNATHETIEAKVLQEGDLCPDCNAGRMGFNIAIDCSCHISAPCKACEDNPMVCLECGFKPEQ